MPFEVNTNPVPGRGLVAPQLRLVPKDSNDCIQPPVVIEVSDGETAMRGSGADLLRRYKRAGVVEKHSVWLAIALTSELLDIVRYVRVGGEHIFPAVIVQVGKYDTPSTSTSRS